MRVGQRMLKELRLRLYLNWFYEIFDRIKYRFVDWEQE